MLNHRHPIWAGCRWVDLYVDAAELGQILVGQVELTQRVDELRRLLAGRCAQELSISN